MAYTSTPLTPSNKHNSSSRPGTGSSNKELQDSPFSEDYFSNFSPSSNNFSSDRIADGAHYDDRFEYTAPSPETQNLLVRLSKLQSQLMRSGSEDNRDGITERDTLNIVGRKMSEIEGQLGALHSQTRMPPELEEGLFMAESEDEEEEEESEGRHDTPNGHSYGEQMMYRPLLDGAMEEPVTPENRKAEHDFLLVEAQKVLESVTRAQEQLRQRHVELRELNDTMIQEMEDRTREIGSLKEENESMRSDLGFDHSELLFLQLQMKALEVDVEVCKDETGDGVQDERRKKLVQQMQQWRNDWQDIDGRMKRRRERYGIRSADVKRDSIVGKSSADHNRNAESDWRVETVVRKQGRVQRITILRQMEGQEDGSVEDEEKAEELDVAHDTPRDSPSEAEGSPEAQRDYTDIGVQTELVSSAWSVEQDATKEDSQSTHTPVPAQDEEEEEEEEEDYDCAITTSSEDDEENLPASGLEVGEDRVSTSRTTKSAWADLWENLASLAGVKEDY